MTPAAQRIAIRVFSLRRKFLDCLPGAGIKRWMLLPAVLSLVCGCASIPTESLNAYVGSVGEARQAGQTLLADWRSARAESDRRTSVANQPTELIPLVRTNAASAGNILSSEDVRALAWEAIAEYTAVLARLNAGESVSDVKQTTGRLFALASNIAGSAVPGGGALVTLLQELAGHIEQARLAAEFKKAVRAGAPIVRRIINEVLLPDINSHYGLRATLTGEDYAAVLVEDDLDADGKKLKQARILDEFNAFKGSLDAYEALLVKTGKSLEAMESAVDRPIDFAVEANALLDLTTNLKQHWTAYENARREGRN